MARTFKLALAVALVALALVAVWQRTASRLFLRHASAPVASGHVPHGGELVASIRSEPATYNRYLPSGASAATDMVTLLTQARLVRVNRATDEIEPWLAEGWTEAEDGLEWTLRLRPDVRFSDGEPFSSADVIFSFRAAYDARVGSPLRAGLLVNGTPLDVAAPDPHTVVIRFPERFAPGLRLLDSLPILPRHRLEDALDAGTFGEQWGPARPLADLAGLGPFVLAEHVSGQRMVFARNPHYFRRDAGGARLPYLDRLTLAVVPDQATEALRLEAGETDLMASGEIRPQDYAGFKRLADQGRLRLIEAGIGLDPDFLSFNLRPRRGTDARSSWLHARELRQAIAWGVDRSALVNTVYLGAAVPIYGPVSPGNRTWYSEEAPAYPHDPARARELLASIGLRDADGDGMLEDAAGRPARFSIITQAGHIRERVAAVLQEQLRQLGLAIDVVGLDPGGIVQRWNAGEYDAMYFGFQVGSTDPALTPQFWLSSGVMHVWNPAQPEPATAWEARIDELMRAQASDPDPGARRRAFAEVQRIFGEELPSIYFVAPRVMLATSPRVVNAMPAPQIPQLLWSADTLGGVRRAIGVRVRSFERLERPFSPARGPEVRPAAPAAPRRTRAGVSHHGSTISMVALPETDVFCAVATMVTVPRYVVLPG